MSQDSQQQITEFLRQPLRGTFYTAVPVIENAPPAPANMPYACEYVEDPGLTLFTGVGSIEIRPRSSGFKCVHETANFLITYVLDGVGGSLGRDSIDRTPDDLDDLAETANCPNLGPSACNGVPDYVDKLARGLDDAYHVYADVLEYRHPWTVKIPVQIEGGITKGQVLPNNAPGAPTPIAPTETIQIPKSDPRAYYLAHHELFHVFQYRYLDLRSVAKSGVTHFFPFVETVGPWWWMEATADWASGYVTRSGKPGDENEYAGSLVEFLARPGEKLSTFDKAGNRQYGAFILAEYLVRYLHQDANGNAVPDPGVIREVFDWISTHDWMLSVETAIDGVAQRH